MNKNKSDLLTELVKTSFKLKYNDSILGFIWVLLKPFLQFLILYVVFSQLGRGSEIKSFAIYLILGLVLFSFFQEGILLGLNSLRDKAHIILKVNFDKSLAIYSSLLLALINLSVNLIIVFVFSVFQNVTPTIESVVYFIFVIVVLAFFIISIAFLTSILSIKVKDLQHLSEIGLQLLFYATPIFYNIEIVPTQFRPILELNPLYMIIQACRAAIIDGQIINVEKVLGILVISIILSIINFSYFKSQISRIAEYF